MLATFNPLTPTVAVISGSELRSKSAKESLSTECEAAWSRGLESQVHHITFSTRKGCISSF